MELEYCIYLIFLNPYHSPVNLKSLLRRLKPIESEKKEIRKEKKGCKTYLCHVVVEGDERENEGPSWIRD